MGVDFDWLAGYVERVHDRTYEVAALLTDELLNWRPSYSGWSTAELVTHIANARLMNSGNIAGGGLHYEGHEPPPRATVQVLRRHLEYTSTRSLERLRAADLSGTTKTVAGLDVPAFMPVFGGLIEHEVHHRSQLCEYLAAAGVDPPPLYGLHEEDLPA
jgi:uncharacterized damage-inducible protein DinB